MRNTVHTRITKKLTADTASILTPGQIAVVTREVWRLVGPALSALSPNAAARVEDVVRWSSLKTRCERARDERGVSVKDAALALRVSQYRLKAAESGTLSELQPEVARRYFRFLGIEAWVRRWCRANPELVGRAGIAPHRKGSRRS
jgi:hypothetical protein